MILLCMILAWTGIVDWNYVISGLPPLTGGIVAAVTMKAVSYTHLPGHPLENGGIQLAEKFNGLKVLIAAVLVGPPLAAPAVVV